MSINLCADQLLMTVARPEQIASLSWLAGDPDDSVLAREAQRFLPNYGSAEELLNIDPDLVLAGPYTATFAGGLADRLGFKVLTVPPAMSLQDVFSNLRLLGNALHRQEKAEEVIADMQANIDELIASRPRAPLPTVFVRAGGFTVGEKSLANDVMRLAGLYNVAAAAGLDRWGSLSMEALLTSGADLMIVSNYRSTAASLTNQTLQHPAFKILARRIKVREIPANLLACGGPWNLLAGELMTGRSRTETL